MRNEVWLECSIVEAYTINEALTFCSMYCRGSETCFTQDEMNDDNWEE